MMVWGGLSVYFPESYSEGHIKSIEQEYGSADPRIFSRLFSGGKNGAINIYNNSYGPSGILSKGYKDRHLEIEDGSENQGGPGEPLEQEWQTNTNSAGYSHLHKYGFGRVDAGAAVEKTLEWSLVAPEQASQEYSSATLGLGHNGLLPGGSYHQSPIDDV
ncbi:hypothetical protein CSA56_18040 [candidate division KSB3 bacterium]|uniref:Uncharacterized protein n=1 Tax=candidate division KSB3 bacterium TaxID=2044937 RepID=A0A2G6K792_9BACT|nr:MAG: hypothetical protein CSA56_18040 [candidate division KSB3 bacterium]